MNQTPTKWKSQGVIMEDKGIRDETVGSTPNGAFRLPSGAQCQMTANFLDDIPKLDWLDLPEAARITKSILHRLSADKDLLRCLVLSVQSDPAMLAMCEHHRLLNRIVIYDALDRGFRIRVHLSTDDHFDRPHDHRFNFTTIILRGSYRHIWYKSPAAPGQDIDSLSDATFHPVFVTSQEAGSSYTVRHDVFHSTITTPDTVSLFLRGPAEKVQSIVVDRETKRAWWQYGQEMESHDRRRHVSAGEEGYRDMVSRLQRLHII